MNGAAGGKQTFCAVITLWLGEKLMSVLGRKPLMFLFSVFPSFLFAFFSSFFERGGVVEIS